MSLSLQEKMSKPFDTLSQSDLKGFGQKGINCGLILQDLDAIVANISIKSDIPIIAVPGFVFHGNSYRRHINENNLLPKIEVILDAFNSGNFNQYECSAKIYSLFDETDLSPAMKLEISENRDTLIRFVAKKLDISFEEAQDSVSNYFRSNADIGEDGQVVDGLSDEEIREMIGAGKHESYGTNFTLPQCYKSALQVMASTFSPQACGQYKGQRGLLHKWLQLDVNMCFIQMIEVFSVDVGSALSFGEITGDWLDLTFGKNMQGDDLVGGSEQGVTVSYHIPTKSIDYWSNTVDFITENTILAVAETTHELGKKYDIDLDSELGCGALANGSKKYFFVPVQFRDFAPVRVEKNTTTLEVHDILDTPSKEYLVASGLAAAKRCAVGKIVSDRNGFIPDVTGKILLAKHANPSYSGLIKEASGFIFESGTLNCHMGIMTRGRRAALFSAKVFDNFTENEIVTILGKEAYRGDWSDKFKINFLDLLKSKVPTGMKAGFVDDGNNAFLGDLYPFLKLGLSEGYNLLRQEANLTTHGIPSPLSFIHYNQLDLTTEGGQKTKAFIDNAMLAFGTNDPEVAFRKLSVSKLARPMALCKAFGKTCSVRLYGARLNEHDNWLKPGFLPIESNPMFGYNGILMYLEDWGKDVLKLSVQVLEDLRLMGYGNTELFIPNVATIQGVDMVLDMIESYNINPTNWDLKVMMENQEFLSKKNLQALANLAVRRGFRKVSKSFGWNDLRNGTASADLRGMVVKDGRGNLDSERYTDQVSESIEFANSIGIDSHSCGVPTDGMLKCMKNANAKSVGLSPGEDFVNGLAVLNA
jgi:phosphoenolpyruvate synthase/pyruvate phosphate dikinase